MSEATGTRNALGAGTAPDPDLADWRTAATHGKLLSALWAQAPTLHDLVPASLASDSTLQKVLDYGSVPARLAVNALTGTANDMADAYNSPAGTPTRTYAATRALLDVGAATAPMPGPVGLRSFGGMWAEPAAMPSPIMHARLAEMAGKTAEQIHAETGWYRDVDGMLKFEIPNDEGRLTGVVSGHKNAAGLPIVGPRTGLPIIDHYPEIVAKAGEELNPHGLLVIRNQGAGTRPDKLTLLNSATYDPVDPKSLPPELQSYWNYLQDANDFHAGRWDKRNPPKVAVPEGGTTLGELYSDPKLYAAYPHLRDVKVEPAPPGATYHGAVWEGQNRMEMASLSARDFQATLLHEIQHLIQAREGFARGTSSAVYQAMGYSAEEAWELYHRSAGEVEARNAAERWEQGIAGQGLPTKTTGYPTKDQIVFFDPSGPMAHGTPVDHNPFGETP